MFRKHHSYLISSGPDGRLYWSYFFKLAQRAYGNDIPTFTKEDEKEILGARANDNITPTLKFQHLLNTKVSYTLVPLEEYVFKQWYFRRMITIGDAAHMVGLHRNSGFDYYMLTVARFFPSPVIAKVPVSNLRPPWSTPSVKH